MKADSLGQRVDESLLGGKDHPIHRVDDGVADRHAEEGGIGSGDVVGLVLAVDRLAFEEEEERMRRQLATML